MLSDHSTRMRDLPGATSRKPESRRFVRPIIHDAPVIADPRRRFHDPRPTTFRLPLRIQSFPGNIPPRSRIRKAQFRPQMGWPVPSHLRHHPRQSLDPIPFCQQRDGLAETRDEGIARVHDLHLAFVNRAVKFEAREEVGL